MESVITVTLGVAISAALVVWRAFVIGVLWEWFMTPLVGLQVPHLAVIIGLWAMVRCVIAVAPLKIDLPKSDYHWEAVGYSLFNPLFLLVIGFIAKQFI